MFDVLLNKEQIQLREEVLDFVRGVPRDLIMNMDSDRVKYPKEYIQELAKRRLLGLRFPKEYGGRGLTWVDEIVALEEIGAMGSFSLGCLYALPSIIGEALHVFGSEEQKQKYLKSTLEGELCCAEALTEPRGGSDFFGATTSARKEGSRYLLNGQKRFIVGAEGADYFLVYVKTRLDAPGHKSLSLFVVDREAGVEVRYLYGLMGTRGGGTGRILFKDTPVPERNLIGRENGAAEIFYRMMIPERLTTAAAAIGLARVALEIATRYSSRRKAFGQEIMKFQGVSFRIADSIIRLDAARGLVYAAARTVDEGKDMNLARRLVSESKRFATEACWQIVNDAMQVMGGIGYTSVYPVERLLRDARLGLIWVGSSEVMNLIIQHEYYRETLSQTKKTRDVEADAPDADKAEEKVYE